MSFEKKRELEGLPVDFTKALALARLRLDCLNAVMANGSNIDRTDPMEKGRQIFAIVTEGLEPRLGLPVLDNSRKGI